MSTPQTGPTEDLKRIIASAERLGIELDEAEALQWLTAMAVDQADDKIVINEREGIFGHRVSMLDFSTEDPGSAAQSKIQAYPGDADYFERVNILAATREAACKLLGEIIRDKALETIKGPNYQLIQVRMGSYPQKVVREGVGYESGASIEWDPAELRVGQIEVSTLEGQPMVIHWDQAARDPGWCKLDWVVADPVRNVSPVPKITSVQARGSEMSQWYLGIKTGSLSSRLPTTDLD